MLERKIGMNGRKAGLLARLGLGVSLSMLPLRIQGDIFDNMRILTPDQLYDTVRTVQVMDELSKPSPSANQPQTTQPQYNSQPTQQYRPQTETIEQYVCSVGNIWIDDGDGRIQPGEILDRNESVFSSEKKIYIGFKIQNYSPNKKEYKWGVIDLNDPEHQFIKGGFGNEEIEPRKGGYSETRGRLGPGNYVAVVLDVGKGIVASKVFEMRGNVSVQKE